MADGGHDGPVYSQTPPSTRAGGGAFFRRFPPEPAGNIKTKPPAGRIHALQPGITNAVTKRRASLFRSIFRAPGPVFRNRYPHGRPGLRDLLRWNRERRRLGLPAPPKADLSPVPPDLERLRSGAPRGRVTWIGHSTLLVQMAGLNILTDPHFSAYAAPVPGLGPRRWQPPGLGLDELPGVDMVLISHNHYDHLDLPSVRALAARNPDALFAVPRGLEKWFATRMPHAQVRSMDWDERLPADSGTGLEVCFVSVQHWSKRGLWDTDRSLWGGFALLSAGMRFFFAGDLGYSAACRDIGRLYGPFDLAAIPIGAYEPRWFMHNQHINPEEAVQVHRDIRSRRSLGIHWGTFHGITDEPLDQPPVDLAEARERAGLPPEEFFVLRHGQSVDILED